MCKMKHTHSKLDRRQARQGYLFLIPLLIGLVWFFLVPIVQSLLFSVCNVSITGSGYNISWAGFGSYVELFTEDADYLPDVVEAFIKMAWQSPLIIIFSFFMASVLNQKFAGRTFFRVMLFLPVIIVSSAMTSVDSADLLQYSMNGYQDYKGTFSGTISSFTAQFAEYLQSVGFSSSITETITKIVDEIYNVIKLSGIQILVLLTGMQSISPSLYEAAKVEGATAWENFWKITFPMVSPLILTCIVYTVVDSFTRDDNGVMKAVKDMALVTQDLSMSAAMAWIYLIGVIAVLGVLSFIISRLVFYYDD